MNSYTVMLRDGSAKYSADGWQFYDDEGKPVNTEELPLPESLTVEQLDAIYFELRSMYTSGFWAGLRSREDAA